MTWPARVSPNVAAALRDGRAVVALESSVFAQGLPQPANREAARRMLAAIRARGAEPAITGVVRGVPTVGVEDGDLERFLARDGVRKASARDIPLVAVAGGDGATTVAASLALAHAAGVAVFATGGIGGVHRVALVSAQNASAVRDESADLEELARTPMIVVCAGAKTILDLPATMERLESLGIAVVGHGTNELPGFLTRGTGISLAWRVDSPAEIAAAWRMHGSLGRSQSLVVVQPPPADCALSREMVDGAVNRALDAAARANVHGASLTPWLLSKVEQETGGASLAANVALLESNAALAAEIATELATPVEIGRARA
ncbi:MAG TPA: pseudouridine-5'-phosphate glycosidase [Gemmatimonadaceae bacterium]|nr:pseudouridine-5'-phosphate glycosidase [Gemmatimonadaceae bacterium]